MPDDFSRLHESLADGPGDAGPPHIPQPGPATPVQDSWLLKALGLDVHRYGPANAMPGGILRKKAAPPKPVPRAQLGQPQQKRADALLLKFPVNDQALVKAILIKAKPAEKAYLTKAIASGHTAGQVEAFYKKIEGKSAAWLDENLHITGAPSGKGVKQQWSDSCVPTTVQAMKGELDPIYALATRQANPNLSESDDNDGFNKNPALALEQEDILVENDGVATNRNNRGGRGMNVAPVLKTLKKTTGLDFATTTLDAKTFDASMTNVARAVQSGLPVPLEIGTAEGGHCVLITGTDKGPPRRYSIHDPWEGKLYTFTEQDLKDGFKPKGGKFQIAGWKTLKFAYIPAMAKPGAK